MENLKILFQVCWSLLNIEITVFDYSFTLLQIFYFGIIAYGIARLVFRLIGSGGDE